MCDQSPVSQGCVAPPFNPRPEAGIALNMRSEISMFLDVRTTYYDHETDASNIQKAKNWPIGLILYYRAASTYPRSIRKKMEHEDSVTFGGRSSALKMSISDNRLVCDCTKILHSGVHIGVYYL